MQIRIPTDLSIGSSLLITIIAASWVSGVVIAKGLWSTLFSLFLIPYAWYLTAEVLLNNSGLI